LSVGQVPKVRALRLGANLGSHNLQFKKVFSTIADSKKEPSQNGWAFFCSLFLKPEA
jgi:hypothetical protein